jgi:voltage-gated potassium channel
MESRRAWLGLRAAVLLPALVAVLSITTGIVNISQETVRGPLATYIPETVAQTAGFTGTLTGFLLLVSVFGLRRRLQVAWWATVFLLPVAAVQGLAQVSDYSLPLVVLSLLSLPTVLLNYGHFERDLDLSPTQLAAVVALVGGQVYGTVGAYALREEFAGVDTLVDAFYYSVVTATTVGYGDVTPMASSGRARLFAVTVLVIGTASFALALGSLLGPAIEARLSQALGTMTDTDIELMEDHVVVLGYGELSEPILEELTDATEFVVVTPDNDRAAAMRARGITVIVGDPSDEEPLERAGIDRARACVAATNDDAQDALAILTASQMNPEARIVAAATERQNVEKLRRAGADTVISPAVIGGHLIVQSALGEEGMEDLASRLLDVPDEDAL